MDETKSLTQTEGSRPPVEDSGGSPDETKSLTRTEGLQPPVEGSGGSPNGDPSKIGRYLGFGLGRREWWLPNSPPIQLRDGNHSEYVKFLQGSVTEESRRNVDGLGS